VKLAPSAADHAFAKMLSLQQVPLRQMCAMLGERMGRGKPLGAHTFYRYFRTDMVATPLGRKKRLRTLYNAKQVREDVADMILALTGHGAVPD